MRTFSIDQINLFEKEREKTMKKDEIKRKY